MSERILVVKLADLGDVLLSEPALRSLRAAFPSAQIDLLVPPGSAELASLIGHDVRPMVFDKRQFDRPVSMANPMATRKALIQGLKLRREKYTIVALLHHLTTAAGALKFRALASATSAETVAGLDNGRGTFLTHKAADLGFGIKHESEYMLSVALAAGGHPVDSKPSFPATSVAESPVAVPSYIVIHPVTGGYAPARTWDVGRWSAVASQLGDEGYTSVIVGAADATAAAASIREVVPDAIDLTARTSIPQLAGLLSSAACVLGGDSFVGHLASALGRPTVSVFGPSNASAWRPLGDITTQRVVLHPVPCQPCVYTGFSLGRPTGCSDRTCLKLVSVEDVVASARAILEVRK